MLSQSQLQLAKQEAMRQIQIQEKRQELIKIARKQEAKLRKHLNLDKLMAVRLVDHFPKKGILIPQNEFMTPTNQEIFFPRPTIHFTLNGPVGSHGDGNWDGCAYAILIPLRKIFSRIFNLSPEDTYIVGGLTLPRGSLILGTQSNLRNKNGGNAKLISIQEGESMPFTVRRILQEKGYPSAHINAWDWNFEAQTKAIQEIAFGQDIDSKNLIKIAARMGKEKMPHDYSIFGEIEKSIKQLHHLMFSNFQPNIKFIEGQISLNQNFIKEISSMLKSKRRGPIISSDEVRSLERLEQLLVYIEHELEILLHKAQFKNQYGWESSILEHSGDLVDKEKEWLISQTDVVNKLKESITNQDHRETKKLIRSIGRQERKLYSVYAKLQEKLKNLRADTSFTADYSDIENQIKYYESILAVTLSGRIGELNKKIESNDFSGAQKELAYIKQAIVNLIISFEKLKDLILKREKFFKKYYQAK